MRSRSVERFRRRPAETQRKELERLLRECARTEFGRRYGFGEIRTPEAFAQRVERFDYTSFKPYVERMMAGEADVAAPGRVRWFARSSGTTSERSKYLPVTDVSLWRCHTRGLRHVATLYVGQYPSTRVFEGKTLTLGGTCSKSGGIVVGDLSALLVERTSFWSGWFRTPRRETALLADFDEKVERICRECASERVTAFAGVPSWNLALLRRMVEYTGRRNLCEVWPHLELFAHGGVGFEPYRAAFRELIPSAGMHYMETYNASEGFFAIADDASRDDMLLMLDYGTYYEFRDGDEVVPLEGVQAGRRYAMLISSCNGLWRYELGDVVEFTSTDPYRIRVAGRTRQFINAFGEEVVMENAERAVTVAAEATGVGVYGRSPLHDAARAGRPRMDRGVRPRSGEFRCLCPKARRRTDAAQLRLRGQTPQYDGAARDACRSGGYVRPLDVSARQKQGSAPCQRPQGVGGCAGDDGRTGCGGRRAGVAALAAVVSRFAGSGRSCTSRFV